MSEPKVEIALSESCANAKIVVNGADITHAVKRIVIEQSAGSLPKVELHLCAVPALIKVQAATKALVDAGALKFSSESHAVSEVETVQ